MFLVTNENMGLCLYIFALLIWPRKKVIQLKHVIPSILMVPWLNYFSWYLNFQNSFFNINPIQRSIEKQYSKKIKALFNISIYFNNNIFLSNWIGKNKMICLAIAWNLLFRNWKHFFQCSTCIFAMFIRTIQNT